MLGIKKNLYTAMGMVLPRRKITIIKIKPPESPQPDRKSLHDAVVQTRVQKEQEEEFRRERWESQSLVKDLLNKLFDPGNVLDRELFIRKYGECCIPVKGNFKLPENRKYDSGTDEEFILLRRGESSPRALVDFELNDLVRLLFRTLMDGGKETSSIASRLLGSEKGKIENLLRHILRPHQDAPENTRSVISFEASIANLEADDVIYNDFAFPSIAEIMRALETWNEENR